MDNFDNKDNLENPDNHFSVGNIVNLVIDTGVDIVVYNNKDIKIISSVARAKQISI